MLMGWNPASHTGYWEDAKVGKIIAEKLAIDWLRVNKWDKKEKTITRTKKYKEWDKKEKTIARTKKYKERYDMPPS